MLASVDAQAGPHRQAVLKPDRRIIATCLRPARKQVTHPKTLFQRDFRPFLLSHRTGSFEMGPKHSSIETRSSGVRGVALGKVSLANPHPIEWSTLIRESPTIN